MREAYENAVAESERSNVKKDIEIRSEKARTIKEKFEKGEVLPDESDEEPDKKAVPRNEDVDVFEAGRYLFLILVFSISEDSHNGCIFQFLRFEI